jgi:hypothetical protein
MTSLADELNMVDNIERIDEDVQEELLNNEMVKINIYRYKFTDNFTQELYKFSKIHQYDHRKDFKEAWAIWTECNDDIVSVEVQRLTNLGYTGDILDKMFKSARYFFRKKSAEKKAPVVRCQYIGVHKDLLDSMDKHIEINIRNTEYKPSEAFNNYCAINKDLLREEVTRLLKLGLKDSIEIGNKIKKTYKNRYFLFVK